jgi:hypothetical protein
MATKLTKITIGGKAIPEICPKCKEEGSLTFSTHLKWSVQAKWQFFIRCELCTYEEDVK